MESKDKKEPKGGLSQGGPKIKHKKAFCHCATGRTCADWMENSNHGDPGGRVKRGLARLAKRQASWKPSDGKKPGSVKK